MYALSVAIFYCVNKSFIQIWSNFFWIQRYFLQFSRTAIESLSIDKIIFLLFTYLFTYIFIFLLLLIYLLKHLLRSWSTFSYARCNVMYPFLCWINWYFCNYQGLLLKVRLLIRTSFTSLKFTSFTLARYDIMLYIFVLNPMVFYMTIMESLLVVKNFTRFARS